MTFIPWLVYNIYPQDIMLHSSWSFELRKLWFPKINIKHMLMLQWGSCGLFFELPLVANRSEIVLLEISVCWSLLFCPFFSSYCAKWLWPIFSRLAQCLHCNRDQCLMAVILDLVSPANKCTTWLYTTYHAKAGSLVVRVSWNIFSSSVQKWMM